MEGLFFTVLVGMPLKKTIFIHYLFFFFFLICSSPVVNADRLTLDLLVYEEHLTPAQTLLSDDRPCYQKSLFEQPNIHMMELVLMCKALYLGGLDFSVNLVGAPTQLRAVRALQAGEFVAFANSVWGYLKNEEMYLSAALVGVNEYKKGVYTAKENIELLKVKKLGDLKQFRAVLGSTWHLDRKVLDCFELPQEFVPNYKQMIKMVGAKRVDYILHNFGALEGAVVEEFGVALYPVEGMQFSLPDSLHFFVSKKHKAGKRVHKALAKGLQILDDMGEVRRAYASIGFYNLERAGWQEFKCEFEKEE